MNERGAAVAPWQAEPAGEDVASPPTRGVRRDAWRMLRRARLGLAGMVILLLIALAAVTAPLIAPHDPYQGNLSVSRQCPAFTVCPNLGGSFARNTATQGSLEYPLG